MRFRLPGAKGCSPCSSTRRTSGTRFPLVRRTGANGFHDAWESYAVGVSGRFAADELGRPVLTVRISLLEAANARLVKIRFFDGRIETQWSELPGKTYLNDALSEVKGQSALLSSVLERSDEELLRFRITRILEPRITLLERGQTL